MSATLDHPPTTAPRFGQLFGRFALAGLVAGVLAGLWSLVVTERAIAPALAIEEARESTHGAHEHAELFGRGTQLVGGFLGTVAAGVVFSLVFAVVFASLRHRLPARTDLGRVLVLAAIGFGVFALLPALTIPANPPAVGDPDTVGRRTAIYAASLACGAIIALLVSAMVGVLRDRGVDTAPTAVAATVLTVALVALTVVLLPENPDAIGADVPAAVVWDFRLASLGQLAVLWTSLGLAAGWLLDRLTRR